MNKTKIEWVVNADGSQGYTWNPIVGCSPASEGCANCYARDIARRFCVPWGNPVFHEERLDEPFRRAKPSTIFVCSMSDLFHEAAPPLGVNQILDMIEDNKRHKFILLTKRALVMRRYFAYLSTVPENVIIGVTAENQARWDERVPVLMSIPARVRFVSVEPMLGPVRLGKLRPDWVIAGPENGSKARPCNPAWIDDLAAECAEVGIPFFDKRPIAKAIRQVPWINGGK